MAKTKPNPKFRLVADEPTDAKRPLSPMAMAPPRVRELPFYSAALPTCNAKMFFVAQTHSLAFHTQHECGLFLSSNPVSLFSSYITISVNTSSIRLRENCELHFMNEIFSVFPPAHIGSTPGPFPPNFVQF